MASQNFGVWHGNKEEIDSQAIQNGKILIDCESPRIQLDDNGVRKDILKKIEDNLDSAINETEDGVPISTKVIKGLNEKIASNLAKINSISLNTSQIQTNTENIETNKNNISNDSAKITALEHNLSNESNKIAILENNKYVRIQYDLLWTNTNGNVSFSSGGYDGDISLYDEFLVTVFRNTNGIDQYPTSQFILYKKPSNSHGNNGRIQGVTGDGGTYFYAERTVADVSDGGIHFGYCTYINGTSIGECNEKLVPYELFGIRRIIKEN